MKPSNESIESPVLYPKNLYEYIELMKVRTAMYIGENTLTAMSCHIDGYHAACYFKGIDEKLKPDFNDFHDYVAKYYKRFESTRGWSRIILEEHNGDEKTALQSFFKIFDLFIQNK